MSASSSDLYEPFTGEKIRGMIASLVASVSGNAMNIFGQSVLHLNPLLSTALFLQLGGNLIGYFLDIVAAKEKFSGTRVPYTDILKRVILALRSFSSTMFSKFTVTVIIDTVIVIEMLKTALDVFDAYDIKFKFRNEITAAFISLLTFVLWVNALRFNWAYVEEDNPLMNIVMIAWLGLTLMVFCATRNIRSRIATLDNGTKPATAPTTIPIQWTLQ